VSLDTELQHDWDLAVIGGGTAGIVGAKTAAGLGARVVLIERHKTGGDCLWTGCVPSKALLAAAGQAAEARTAERLGVKVSGVEVDFSAVMRHVHSAIAVIEPVDSAAALEAADVTVIRGDARFTSARTLDVDGTSVRFRHAMVATGATPAIPLIPGLDGFPFLTSETLWDLTSLPHRLAVLGGGSIGCELGQAFARLGAEVTVIEAAPRILPREDPDASAVVAAALTEDGVTILVGRPVAAVHGKADGSGELTVDEGNGSMVAFDRLLIAGGRSPRTHSLGLDTAGIELDPRGFVVVDDALRTTNKRVWAAGDLTGHPQFTHLAGVHGSLAASNAVLGLRRKVNVTAVPRVTFTDPEVAAVGVPTADSAPLAGVESVTRHHSHVDRAVAEDDTSGFARLALDGKGRVVGATVVGPRAGETLPELTLAIRMGLRTRDLASTIHAYPTYADGPWNAAIDDVRQRLQRPALVRATKVLLRFQRARSS
jgi:pyruvate/2-oxoglutarate dehydrogenase complex dihydrolipoamide dehydrogenase (E3) component